MKRHCSLLRDQGGYAVVEATILFPIMMMIFAGLVLLAMYLPIRAALQRETQYAATVLATESSDTWLQFDTSAMEYTWLKNLPPEKNVYAALISSFFKGDAGTEAEAIVEHMEGDGLFRRAGDLTVECEIVNYVIYKEIIVTATRAIPVPVNLSFVHFPTEIPITVSSTAVVQNGDEFVRNIDIAKDFLSYLDEKYDLHFDEISKYINEAWEFLGI